MNHLQSYERILPIRARGKQLFLVISLLLLYALVAATGGVIFLNTLNPSVALLTFLITLTLVLFTKKYLHTEYEYAFVGGRLTVARIYGKRSRKTVVDVDMSQLLLVDYDGKRAREAVLRMNPEETVVALSTPNASPTLLFLWEENKKKRKLLCIESDQRTEELLRRNYPHVCSAELRRGIQPS